MPTDLVLVIVMAFVIMVIIPMALLGNWELVFGRKECLMGENDLVNLKIGDVKQVAIPSNVQVGDDFVISTGTHVHAYGVITMIVAEGKTINHALVQISKAFEEGSR